MPYVATDHLSLATQMLPFLPLLKTCGRHDSRDASLDLNTPCFLVYKHAAVSNECHVLEAFELIPSAMEIVRVGY